MARFASLRSSGKIGLMWSPMTAIFIAWTCRVAPWYGSSAAGPPIGRSLAMAGSSRPGRPAGRRWWRTARCTSQPASGLSWGSFSTPWMLAPVRCSGPTAMAGNVLYAYLDKECVAFDLRPVSLKTAEETDRKGKKTTKLTVWARPRLGAFPYPRVEAMAHDGTHLYLASGDEIAAVTL